jgi:putative ABC transport system permease protein
VVSFRLIRRNLTKHKMRSALTIASLMVGVFLLCVLKSMVVALESGVAGAKRDRLVVQSAVSLFVGLPLSYQQRIGEVQGVQRTCKWQWFGAYYQEPSNFMGAFATDNDTLFDIYPEIEVIDGSIDEWRKDRSGCLVGDMLAQQFGWKVGQTIPLISVIFLPPGGDVWNFTVRAIYKSESSNVDRRTFFFNWDYFQKSYESVMKQSPDVGLFVMQTTPGADQNEIMRTVEALYENGPQRVQCTTEAAFQAQFLTMMGNVPFLVNSIGGGVLVAIALACINTMLMAFRDQAHDVGILKALGFTDGSVAGFMVGQSLLICAVGGGLGILLVKGLEPVFLAVIGTMFPGYAVTGRTIAIAALVTVAIGVAAGVVPAIAARRLRCVEALRSVE